MADHLNRRPAFHVASVPLGAIGEAASQWYANLYHEHFYTEAGDGLPTVAEYALKKIE